MYNTLLISKRKHLTFFIFLFCPPKMGKVVLDLVKMKFFKFLFISSFKKLNSPWRRLQKRLHNHVSAHFRLTAQIFLGPAPS